MSEGDGIASQEVRNFGFYLSKQENEFFIESNHIQYDLFRIRYKPFRTKSDEWHITYQDELIATIHRDKLHLREANLLFKPEGLQAVLALLKEEVKKAAEAGTSVKLGITKIKSVLK